MARVPIESRPDISENDASGNVKDDAINKNDRLKNVSCHKCKHQATHYFGAIPSCSACFIEAARNKFRNAITKNKIYKETDTRDTLIVYDGTAPAAFLLHQIEDGVKQLNFKRLMLSPTVLVVVSTSEPTSISTILERLAQLRSVLPATVPWLVVHEAAGLSEDLQIEKESAPNKCYGVELIPELCSLLSSISNLTYRTELRRIIRERAICHVAKAVGINKIMLPDTGDSLARLSLSLFGIGRGAVTASLCSVVERRQEPSDLTFVRPLHDLTSSHIAIANRIASYDTSELHVEDSEASHPSGSIQDLTSSLITTLLSEGFPQTVPMVLGSMNKIHAAPCRAICRLCRLPLEAKNLDISNPPQFCYTCTALVNEIPNHELLIPLIR